MKIGLSMGQEKWVVEDFVSGSSVEDLAREYDVSQSAIERALREHLIRLSKEKQS